MAVGEFRSKRRSQIYVDGRRGLRFFLFVFLLCAIMGLSVRTYLSPARLRNWIEAAMLAQPSQLGLQFQQAQLSLASGYWPEFAVLLSNVSIRTRTLCQSEAPLLAQYLRVPLRISSLLQGQFAIGTVSASGLVIDFDALKQDCVQKPTGPISQRFESQRADSQVKMSEKSVTSKAEIAPAQPWWKPEDFARARALISGVNFQSVELRFENKSKKVYLDSFTAQIRNQSRARNESVLFKTLLRVPPELAYGEKVPPITMSAEVLSNAANLTINGVLNEGSLQARATLRPAEGGHLSIDLGADVRAVPLSMLEPLLTKSGIITGKFQPRFLWLNCKAQIAGQFQGLFQKSPLQLGDCLIEGQGAKVSVSRAVRQPSGLWEPFAVAVSGLEVRRLLDTFGAEEPEGVLSDSGFLSGNFQVRSANDVAFEGKIENARARFTHRNVQALQPITSAGLKVNFNGELFKGEAQEIQLEGGKFDGEIRGEFSRKMLKGQLRAQITQLQFNEAVQKVLVAGKIGHVTGEIQALLEQGGLRSLRSRLSFLKIEGAQVRAPRADMSVDFQAELGNFFRLHFNAPGVELARTIGWLKSAAHALDGFAIESDWLALSEPNFQARLSPEGVFRWEKARAQLLSAGKATQFLSFGSFDRSRLLTGVLHRGPSGVNRKAERSWHLSGTIDSPELREQ